MTTNIYGGELSETLKDAVSRLSQKPLNTWKVAEPLRTAAALVECRDPRIDGIIKDVGEKELAHMMAAIFLGLLDRINTFSETGF